MKIEDLKEKCNTEEQHMAVNGLILLIRSGSTLYGTRTETSDEDGIGVFIEPEEYRLGRKHIETVELKTNSASSGKRNQKGDLDVTLHSLDKFVGLAENNNPTILELFFAPQNCLMFQNEFGKRLSNSYEMFVSKKCFHSLCGYAYSQIKRNEVKSGNQNGRADLIDKFGYDVKLMSHAVRLYMEAIQLLGTGRLDFPLHQNQMLIDIKKGLFTYEQVQAECKKLEDLTNQVYANSTIRYSPDKEGIHKLQVSMYKDYYSSLM